MIIVTVIIVIVVIIITAAISFTIHSYQSAYHSCKRRSEAATTRPIPGEFWVRKFELSSLHCKKSDAGVVLDVNAMLCMN